MRNRQDFIIAYLKTREPDPAAHFWAWEQMVQLCQDNPKQAAELTVDLLEACETDEQVAYVAAGPIEDLLWGSWRMTFPIFADACKTSRKVRVAMQALALDETEDEVFPMWKALLLEHGLWNSK